MPQNPRTFKLPKPNSSEKIMKGTDVKGWQSDVKKLFKKMGIDCPIKVDGIYGQQSRGFSASLVHASGLSVKTAMKDGVTPELRIKLRNADFTKAQLETRNSKARKEYRAKLRDKWRVKKVHSPLTLITTDDWGFVPGVHDGIDVTGVRPGLPVFAMVKGKVIDVRMGDWWGNNPSGDTSKGDGIVQIEVLETVGPFKKGDHIGYGHTEQPNNTPLVKVGQVVQAGDQIGALGLAVTPHIHLMLNDGSTNQGRGTKNPRAILDYSIKHG
jgi:murein DD-endopeptidase MepM/ murein hydrolase activator NlpD